MATTTSSAYADMTKAELDELARARDIDGRSQMNKDELVDALECADIGPDAVQLLIEQHERIRELFASIEDRASRPSKAKLDDVRELISTLVKHAEVEELVFYPAVREALSDEDLVDESLEEHHAAELLMWELERLPADAPRYDAKVTVLKENVLHHVEEEETELFPKVRDALDEQRRRELGTAMVRAWDIAPSRPHPLSPDTPPGNWLAGIPAAGLDVVVGVVKGIKRRVLHR
ncbi:MAG: hemerythrin domain-containing protein [Nitriliruptor sp.]